MLTEFMAYDFFGGMECGQIVNLASYNVLIRGKHIFIQDLDGPFTHWRGGFGVF